MSKRLKSRLMSVALVVLLLSLSASSGGSSF
jgi:hypothetical protein